MTTSNLVDNRWFRYWQRKPQASLRLFCFPYAGGGASIFHNWSGSVPPEIEICPVQLPGRENRILDEPFSSIQPLIHSLADALQPHLDMPYAFFGHSMGALISFELSHYLYSRGQDSGPVHFFASAHRAPHLPRSSALTYHLSDQAFVEELRRLQGTPEEILQNEELLQLLLPLLRADFTLCDTYVCKHDSQLKCPVTAFGGIQDEEIPYDFLAAWEQQTCKSFKLRYFAGSHFFLRTNQQSLLQSIVQDLLPLCSK